MNQIFWTPPKFSRWVAILKGGGVSCSERGRCNVFRQNNILKVLSNKVRDKDDYIPKSKVEQNVERITFKYI